MDENNFEDFPAIGGLMVSKMVAEENKKPLFMYREKRRNSQDSGWRIFSGLETQEYTDNPDNSGIYNPSTILKIDSSIIEILFKGVGSVYERKDDNSDWYRVTDYELDDDFMAKHLLTDDWTIEINNLFERIKEESGDLLYTTGDKSLRIAIWNDNRSREEITTEHLEQINSRDQTEAKTLNKFNFSNDLVSRIGYEIKEQDGPKEYNVIYAFSIINREILQLAFYFDDEKDKEWALETWLNIRNE